MQRLGRYGRTRRRWGRERGRGRGRVRRRRRRRRRTCQPTPEPTLRAILESFERWADRTGRSLEPCFRTRRAESTITGESTVVCRPPTVALAEYHDGELAHVAPSRVGERVVGIEDRLDALVASGGTEREPSTRSTRSTN
ncbi:HTH domain-containing protein [Halomontanus rarus]|uniref:HTH domain-containing protein n=1 Tax=Halomontanus rarus TaxID=3034020 RepID=UPI00307B9BBE